GACVGSGPEPGSPSASGRSPERSQSRTASVTPHSSGATSPSAVPSVEPGSLATLACSLPHAWLLRTWRGYRPDRSAEIQILPKEYDLVGSGLPHVGSWPYVYDVPVFW